jgi:membrane-associated phospholipid phosphatase
VISLHSLADQLSNTINPLLGLMILEEPLLDQRNAREPWPLFWVRSAIAVGLAVTLAELGKKYQVWHGHPFFPSGHTTFATAAAICLVMRRGPRWLAIAVPLVVLMGWGLAYGHWHTPTEVFGGFLLASLITPLFFRFCTGNNQRS